MPAFYETPTSASNEASVVLNQLFPRDSCVSCPDSTPKCPTCATGESCQVTVPLTCTECPSSYCAADASTSASATSTSSASSGSSSKSKAGAIAGGVVGGVAFFAVLTYLVWRFCVKNKRQQIATKEQFEAQEPVDPDSSFVARRDQRSSTHTVHSIASTVLTRASNIIQIAYIPGVMNRATPTSPNVLVPPVPPIPIAISGSSQSSSPAGTHEQHFFVPGDLRDSTYSDFSGYSDRTSYARTSYAPRSSIASTIYGKNAVIVAPPQTGMRAKPTMVNLKSPSATSSIAPPVPSVDYDKYTQRPKSAANSTFSVGSTFLNSASAAMPVRPVVVRVGNGQKKSPLINDTSSMSSDVDSTMLSPISDKATSPTTGARASAAVTLFEDSPTPDQGPFSDPPASRSSDRLDVVAEESSQTGRARNLTERGHSPFSDEHATLDD